MENLHIIPYSPFGPIFPNILEDLRFTRFICKALRNLVARIITTVLALLRRPSEPRRDATQPKDFKESGLLTDIPEGKDNPLSKKIDPSFSKELTDSYTDPQTGDFQKGKFFFGLAKDFLREGGIPLINGLSSDIYYSPASKIPIKKLKTLLREKLREFGLSEAETQAVISEITNTPDSQKQRPCIEAVLGLIQELDVYTNSDKPRILKGLAHLYQAARGQTQLFIQATHGEWELSFIDRTENPPAQERTFSYNLVTRNRALEVEILSSYQTVDEKRNEKAKVHIDTKVDLQTGIAEIFTYRDPITEI